MSNWLNNFSLFRNFVHQSQESVLGVDIGTSSVKVVQVKNDKGRAVLETYGVLSVGPYAERSVGQSADLSPEKIKTLIGDLFSEANVTSQVASMSIAMRHSLLVTIELPQIATKNLEQAVSIEARKYIPVPISEVALDWWEIPEIGGGKGDGAGGGHSKVNIMLAAIHQNALGQYEKIFKLTGLNYQFFEIETFSILRSVLEQGYDSVVLVDLGASTTKVSIVDQGVIRTSHTINKGSQDISVAVSKARGISFAKAEEIKRKVGLIDEVEAEDSQKVISPIVEYIFSEVSKIVVDYQKKHSRAMEQVILTGGGSLLKGMYGIAKDNLEAPVVLGAPFNRLEAPAFLDDVFKQIGPEFAVAIGLALRGLEN